MDVTISIFPHIKYIAHICICEEMDYTSALISLQAVSHQQHYAAHQVEDLGTTNERFVSQAGAFPNVVCSVGHKELQPICSHHTPVINRKSCRNLGSAANVNPRQEHTDVRPSTLLRTCASVTDLDVASLHSASRSSITANCFALKGSGVHDCAVPQTVEKPSSPVFTDFRPRKMKECCFKTVALLYQTNGLVPGLTGEKDDKAGSERAQRLIGSASEAGGSESDASAVWSPRSCMARLHSKPTNGSSAGRHSVNMS